MSIWWVVLICACLLLVGVGFTWIVVEMRELSGHAGKKKNAQRGKSATDLDRAYADIAAEDINHLFNSAFREELRNLGRLRFEKIIDENAMFLKQDLDLTISQLNDYMHQEIAKKLEEEFQAYSKAMKDAQELALDSLRKTAQAAEEQRNALSAELQKEVAEREAKMLQAYEENMAKIVEHYVLQTLGDQFDLKQQLPFIISQMESNKQAIIEDMRL